MKIFNMENPLKGRPANAVECVVIATWEEWRIVAEAVEAAAKASPRKKKLQAVNSDIGLLAVW